MSGAKKRFDVGALMKARKIAKGQHEKIVEEMEAIGETISDRKQELNAKRMKLHRLNWKVETVVQEIEEGLEVDEPVSKKGKFLSARAVESRRKMPTSFIDGKVQISARVARSRRKETYEAAVEIHGGSVDSSTCMPAEIGLIDTVAMKCSNDTLVEVLSTSKKFVKCVFPKIYKSCLADYEASEDNMVRSVAVYYGGGIMGKKKYRQVYRDVSYKKTTTSSRKNGERIAVSNCPVPLLAPYNKLMPFVKSIPIGTMFSVYDTLCDGLKDQDKVQGCYRSFKEMLLKLAEFYLCKQNGYNLVWFNETNTFYVSLGGDGAPFGKYDTACAWLVGFLNLGKGILSSNENYLLFGANCSENCVPVQRFIEKLMVEIVSIEKQAFPIDVDGTTVHVKFRVAELPNDMKMMAFLAGELSNSAKFFSSFANVSTDNCNTVNGEFGKGKSNTWIPWKYSQRVVVAKAVETMKKKIEKQNVTPATKRSKLTAFIAQKSSRQEFVPPMGELIDRAHVEPLHLKNNACALAHRYLLHEVIANSNLSNSVSSFSQVPTNSPFGKYIITMRTRCHLSRLAKQIIRWFDDTKAIGKEFDYRFTGKDSRLFLHNFMILISCVESGVKSGTRQEAILHILAYICLCLRNCVSLFTRVDISDSQVTEIKQHCTNYFKAHCLFLHVNPTVWTLGNVVPIHIKDMKEKYGMGLGLNSMEGREAKHVFIGKYSTNTLYQYRWQQIFQHEYVTLVWLRERGYNVSKQLSSNLTYIPKAVLDNPTLCYCGMEKSASGSECRFCSHSLRKKIQNSISKGCIELGVHF